MTLITKKIIPFTLLLAGSVLLAACSSKPSPWTESSSPWDNRAAEPEPQVAEAYEPEPSPYEQEETVEPIGFAAAEDQSAPVESAGMAEEPMLEEPMAEPEPVAVIAEEAPATEGGSISTEPAGNFAVQVVASSSMDNLTFFLNQHQLSDQWIAETTVDGRVWFVLMSGVYATKSEAENALAGLQDMGTTPWIRTVGSVHAVMN